MKQFLEYGVVKKRAKHRVALVYPNLYRAGSCSLGFNFIYNLINLKEDFVAERFFLDFEKSLETRSPISDFDVIAFSLSFENDYFNMYKIMEKNKFFKDKLKIAGGICCYNPYPIKKYFDLFFVGDSEDSLQEFLDIYLQGGDIKDYSKIQGIFIPDVRERVLKRKSNLDFHPTYQPIQWGEYPQAFKKSFLLEISRGCSRFCKFCLLSNTVGKRRERSLENIQEILEEAEKRTKFEKIVLIASDSHSKFEEILEICKPYHISMPSVRIENITESMLETISPKTLTIAPETSERLRFEVGKKFTDEMIFEKLKMAKKYIKSVKLYFMVGIPGEDVKDLEEIVFLSKKISKILKTKLTINPFVPKPHTPFSNHKFDVKDVDYKIKFLKKNIRFAGESVKNSFIQYCLSVGDERVSSLLFTKNFNEWKKFINFDFEEKWRRIKK